MKRALIFLITSLIFISCSPTRITVANYKDAVIYVDGIYKGTGEAEIPRLGIRKPVTITAQKCGKEVGSVKIVREFDAGTFFLGLCSYGVGFFVGRKYPYNVIIPTEAPAGIAAGNFSNKKSWDIAPLDKSKSVKDTEVVSAWDLPPSKKTIVRMQTQDTSLNRTKWDVSPIKVESKEAPKKFSDLFSEEKNQISFDSGNTLYIFTEELERKIHLFPKIHEFKSAIILKSQTDSMFLNIETVPNQFRVQITEANLKKIREKVDGYLK